MVSDIGKKHKANEDAGSVAVGEGNVVLVVADGVSSSLNGASGSATAVKVVKDILLSCVDPSDAPSVMLRAIETAHKAIVELPYVSNQSDADGPETTIVAALRHDRQLTIGWVGDSRAYLIDDDSEELLTIDDSWVEMVVRSGELTREEAIVDRRAHYVTQVLGMKDDKINPHVVQTEIASGKILLLCSDGFWNYFQEQGKMLSAIKHCGAQRDVDEICKYLVSQANEQGGHDNITVAMLKI
jgi:serine/threonine protein phosphatase PrpC